MFFNVCVCVSVREKERELLPTCAGVCLCVTLCLQEKLEVISFIQLKPLEWAGRGKRKTKVTGMVGRKSVSLH